DRRARTLRARLQPLRAGATAGAAEAGGSVQAAARRRLSIARRPDAAGGPGIRRRCPETTMARGTGPWRCGRIPRSEDVGVVHATQVDAVDQADRRAQHAGSQDGIVLRDAVEDESAAADSRIAGQQTAVE